MRTSCFQKSTFYAGIKIFNSVTILKNDKAKFQAALRKYMLLLHKKLCIFDLFHFLLTLTHLWIQGMYVLPDTCDPTPKLFYYLQ
jgi:hypothetical protein